MESRTKQTLRVPQERKNKHSGSIRNALIHILKEINRRHPPSCVMAASPRDEEFDEYDKPGAERSRRRRGGEEEDDLDSDLEGDLLEEDWLSSKKNPSELSDEELNDDLLQSDEEDQDTSVQGAAVSLNATSGLGDSYLLQEGDEYADGEYGVTAEGEEEYRAEEYGGEEGVEYNTAGNEDEVLDLQIDEPLDDEFQVEDYGAEPQEVQLGQQEVTEAEMEEPEEEVENVSQVTETEEVEPEAEHEAEMKEESDEDEEDDEESERLRFKTERKDSTVVRLSDTTSKRRNIPETLELTEEAKADLLEFEEKERQRKHGRFCGRGRGGGGGGGGRGGPHMFGMGGFRKDAGGRGRMNESRPPLMPVGLGMRPRMISPQSHRPQPRPSVPSRGGPGLFPPPLIPIPQQPLQSLIPLRSSAPHQRPQPEPHPQRPHGHTHPHTHSNQQQQQQQPKNIHINPHFRGPSPSSPAQVPMISPPPNQPRPNLGPQRFPGPVDFQQHLQNSFLQPQRPPPPQEQWRGPPPTHQERELFFNNEPRFPAQPLFDLPGPAPLLNNNLLPLSFPQPGFCSPGGGMFQRDLPPPRHNLAPPRHNLAPPRNNLAPPRNNLAPPHPASAPPSPRSFMGHRQPFPPQQHNAPFSPQHMPFGMQSLMQPHPQPQHHDPPPHPHHHPMQQQQQHRQEVPPLPHHQHQHQHQHQGQPAEQHPIMHISHSPFRQPILSGPRQMKPRPQNNMGRLRMGSPLSLQQIQNIPQRNSNLRELPIAPGNNHPVRSPQPRPFNKAAQNARPGEGPGGGAFGQGRGLAKATPPPGALVPKNEMPAAQTGTRVQKTPTRTPAQNEDEDEETRQYRLKIEEQKRLREEILKHKELRRQVQAGARKKELLERLGGQAPPQTPPQTPPKQTQTTPTQPQPTPTPPTVTPNGVKTRLQNPSVEQKQQVQNPQRLVPQLQKPSADVKGPPEEKNITPKQTQANAARKRTVMQRAVPGSPQIPQKVRVVKCLTGGDEAPPLQNQPQQQLIGRAAPQQRLGAVRKVTVATEDPQPSTQQPPPQPQQPSDINQSNRVVASGRGRGRGARGARVAPQSRQSARVAESQPSTVSIDGLSSSTTEKQIKNLLNSIGPIQMFKMMPQQRKAIATFVNPQHALSFQHSFHRHMIDLSHIDVTIING
ncbi:RNA-binding protein 33 isoform X2 [Silurus meridionalis]|nr:RNA-binding protein 33 isoform X2 [Silurus meridionalis]